LATVDGTGIANMSRDNGSSKMNGNIECTSMASSLSTMNTSILMQEITVRLMPYHILDVTHNNDGSMAMDVSSFLKNDEDLYSCRYGLETIKTISNSELSYVFIVHQKIIIPLINGTGTVFPVMMICCIRDSLREYKSNYVILSSMKLSLYN
jgi:hypothetical protein